MLLVGRAALLNGGYGRGNVKRVVRWVQMYHATAGDALQYVTAKIKITTNTLQHTRPAMIYPCTVLSLIFLSAEKLVISHRLVTTLKC
jgi:hypothetical protein